MSLLPFYPEERSFRRLFRDFQREFESLERQMVPYWRDLDASVAHSFGSALGDIQDTKEKFSVAVDVTAFQPEEIRVDVAGRELTISGQHEERNDAHGRVSRSFVRKYTLPEDANLDGLRSSLDKDGRLTIEAPKLALEGPQSRTIPIQHTKA